MAIEGAARRLATTLTVISASVGQAKYLRGGATDAEPPAADVEPRAAGGELSGAGAELPAAGAETGRAVERLSSDLMAALCVATSGRTSAKRVPAIADGYAVDAGTRRAPGRRMAHVESHRATVAPADARGR